MRGDGTVYLRGQVYWIKFYRNGEPQREPARDKDGHGITDAVAAQKFLRNRLKELHGEEVGGPAFVTARAKKRTGGDLLDELKADYELRGKASVQNLSHIKTAKEDFGDWLAVAVTPERIDAYIQEKLADGYAPASVNRRLQMLGQSFALAVRRGTLARAPYIRHLSEKGNERQGFFSEQEIMDVLAALPDDGLRDFAEWASETGQRKGEIEQLTWNMVEGDELRIPGEVCKNGRGRVLPIGLELRVILDRRKKARRVVSLDKTEQLSELIFHRGDGRPVGDFKKSWRTATKTAKCAGRLFHDFRRTAARRFIAAGINQNVAKQLTGHLTDSMFSRYQIVSSGDLLAAQSKVAEFRKAATK
jgi:integrase